MTPSPVLGILLLCVLLVNSSCALAATNCPRVNGSSPLARFIRRHNVLTTLELTRAISATNTTQCQNLPMTDILLISDRIDDLVPAVLQQVRMLNSALNTISNFSADDPAALLSPSCSTNSNPFSVGIKLITATVHNYEATDQAVLALRLCTSVLNGSSQVACDYWYHPQPSPQVQWQAGSGLFPSVNVSWWTAARRTMSSTRSLFSAANLSVSELRAALNKHLDFSRVFRTTPYFDCDLQKAWKMTYSMPLYFVHRNSSIHDVGSFSVDVDLSGMDIDECAESNPEQQGQVPGSQSFLNTHLCVTETTTCRVKKGAGFTLGGYRCYCRDGYYRESISQSPSRASHQFFEGEDIHKALTLSRLSDNLCDQPDLLHLQAEDIQAFLKSRFSCKPCQSGCKKCTSGSDVCTDKTSIGFVSALLAVNMTVCLAIASLVFVVVRYKHLHVFRSASWSFLVLILVGSVLPIFGMSIGPAIVLTAKSPLRRDAYCAVGAWATHIGFAVCYGSVFLKTWRLNDIFSDRRFRNGSSKHFTNRHLFVLLLAFIGAYAILLGMWTREAWWLATPDVIGTHANYITGLTCRTHTFDFVLRGANILLLLLVILLSTQLHKTQGYSEARELIAASYLALAVSFSYLTAYTITPSTKIFFSATCLEQHLVFTTLVAFLFFPKLHRLVRASDEMPTTGYSNKKSLNECRGSVEVNLSTLHEVFEMPAGHLGALAKALAARGLVVTELTEEVVQPS